MSGEASDRTGAAPDAQPRECPPCSSRAWPLFPCTWKDKRGLEVTFREYEPSWYDPLFRMYEEFEPKGEAQGLPPATPSAVAAWLAGLLSSNMNLIAVVGGEIAGHVCLTEISQRDRCELLIFVQPCHQNFGIGTQLTRGAQLLARALGYRRIWLMVETTNPRAIHVYEKTGFRFLQAQADLEKEMEVHLF